MKCNYYNKGKCKLTECEQCMYEDHIDIAETECTRYAILYAIAPKNILKANKKLD